MTACVILSDFGRSVVLTVVDGELVSFVERGDGPDPTDLYRTVADALYEVVHRLEGYTDQTRVKL